MTFTDRIDEIAAALVAQHGHLLTPAEAAATLRRPAAGLEATMASCRRREQPWARRLYAGRVRMGKKIFYTPHAVATVIVLGDKPLSAEEQQAFQRPATPAAAGRH